MESGGLADFFHKKAGSLPPPSPGSTVAAAVLTGLLAFSLRWLAALEGWLRTDQPEGRGNRKGPLPSLIPTAPPTLSVLSVGGKTERSHSGRKAGETGSAGGGGEGQAERRSGSPYLPGCSPYFCDLCQSLA